MAVPREALPDIASASSLATAAAKAVSSMSNTPVILASLLSSSSSSTSASPGGVVKDVTRNGTSTAATTATSATATASATVTPAATATATAAAAAVANMGGSVRREGVVGVGGEALSWEGGGRGEGWLDEGGGVVELLADWPCSCVRVKGEPRAVKIAVRYLEKACQGRAGVVIRS